MSDSIDRQAMIDLIEDDSSNGVYSCFASYKDAQKFKQKVMDLSPTQPEREKGHWFTKMRSFTGKEYIQCSKCGGTLDMQCLVAYPYFCPGCGAEMRGRE